ncbi:hypothetical protein B0A55_01835 [Friedmanniomyces simplex]|uniref:Uncharacterized protein n=1 Tax=Friedmanniomyces simplex TaxID=329884 RepID=A0A4U0XIY3_9PEZI|nr:hypothetical protein B0A55_01835 [Friedmanniomyces simplex]
MKTYAFKCHRQTTTATVGTGEGEEEEQREVDVVYPVNALAFHPVHGTFATGGGDGVVAVWDAQTKRRVRQYPKLAASVAAMNFSADGKFLAIGVSPGFEDGKEDEEVDAGSVRVVIRELGESEAKEQAQNDNMRTSTCVTCRDKNTDATSYQAGGHRVCADCATGFILSKFMNALRYEAQYSARLNGSVRLNPADYVDLLPSGYQQELRCKRYEYKMPSRERLHCRNTISSHEATASQITTCDEFLGKRREKRPPSRERDFEGAVRGLDYQICPNEACNCAVYLGEACNHMTCQHHSRRTQFCSVCGEAGAHDVHHWDIGIPCPRYGRPGAANAIHDGDVVLSATEDIDTDGAVTL